MRKSLGSILVFILIFLHVGLSASTYKWSTHSSKNEVYTNEIIYLKYICEFSDRGELYDIAMKAVYDKKKYTLRLMKKIDTFVDGKRRSTYEYLVKAKVDGALALKLNVDMRKTTLESIVDSSEGRDDDRGEEEFQEELLSLNPPSINVKPSGHKIVGEFSVEVKKDVQEVKAYEPYHMDIKFSGNGNLDDIKEISFKIDGVKVFTQKPLIELEYTKDGYHGTWSQKFAFVGDKDFHIPAVKIKYFDLKSKSIKSLDIESADIKVTQVYKKEELLDEPEKSVTFDFEFIYYILTFIAGFLIAKIKFKKEKVNSKEMIFIKKIHSTKSLDELSMLLILDNERKFAQVLSDLDENKSISLSKAKEKVIKLI